MLKIAFVAAALMSLAGCSAFAEAPTPRQEETEEEPNEATPVGTESGGSVGASVPEASDQWTGVLAKTSATAFGGGAGHCEYEVTFADVDVQITLTDGQPTAATVRATMVERVTTESCPIAAAPPTPYFFRSNSITIEGTGATRIGLVGAATNPMQASLAIEANFEQPPPALALEWHRLDQPAPMDWTVTTVVRKR